MTRKTTESLLEQMLDELKRTNEALDKLDDIVRDVNVSVRQSDSIITGADSLAETLETAIDAMMDLGGLLQRNNELCEVHLKQDQALSVNTKRSGGKPS